jgi:predicted DNA-binding transcriptional regulator AlpA
MIYRDFDNTTESQLLNRREQIMEEDFIQPQSVSEITGLSVAALAQLRYQGTGPRFYKPTPRTVLYKRSEVVAWIEESARTSTGRAAAFA